MAQFEWRVSEIAEDDVRAVDIRIPDCGGPGADWVVLEEITVAESIWGVSIEIHFDEGDVGHCWEEDPREYDEEGKAALRALLRHLGYKRAATWTWRRP